MYLYTYLYFMHGPCNIEPMIIYIFPLLYGGFSALPSYMIKTTILPDYIFEDLVVGTAMFTKLAQGSPQPTSLKCY